MCIRDSLYFYQSSNRLQRDLSAIAELIVNFTFKYVHSGDHAVQEIPVKD